MSTLFEKQTDLYNILKSKMSIRKLIDDMDIKDDELEKIRDRFDSIIKEREEERKKEEQAEQEKLNKLKQVESLLGELDLTKEDLSLLLGDNVKQATQGRKGRTMTKVWFVWADKQGNVQADYRIKGGKLGAIGEFVEQYGLTRDDLIFEESDVRKATADNKLPASLQAKVDAK
ncbi:hypothetical protein EX461_07375 [Vibrio parahaemolyticus]|nr:hypothetical protein [Vibrio parahaemolyticus]EJG0013985.1 hypothetical protein [Vibrio parahaemolyticus]EJG0782026.1 hypothetical protein [Vibrio parahaemolyticus]EJS9799236.1 hypothetical protein [Vibrio parahaemolyticus]